MIKNIFSNIPTRLTEELVETLAASGNCRVERILSLGHTSPQDFWYDQSEDEWILLVTGGATLELQDPDTEITLIPGDTLFLPAGRKHRVSWTDPDCVSTWIAVFISKEHS